MHDILDLPEVRACVSRLSVARYHETPEYNENGKRTELIRGIVIEKMSKSPLHATIGALLYRFIEQALPDGLTAWKDEPLTFIDSEPEPDVSVVRGNIQDRLKGHPGTAELAVEVAVTSLALDREKALIYAEAGIREYWIVIPKQRQVEVYRQPADGVYAEQRLYSAADTIECASVPEIRVALDAIFPG
jgi:Uma2 family endonuclease